MDRMQLLNTQTCSFSGGPMPSGEKMSGMNNSLQRMSTVMEMEAVEEQPLLSVPATM
jgi:hypothetical protein